MSTDAVQPKPFRMAYVSAGRESLLVLVSTLDGNAEPTDVLRLFFKTFAIASEERITAGVEASVTIALHETEHGDEAHILCSGGYKLVESAWRALKQIAPDKLVEDAKCVRGGGVRCEVGTIKDGILTPDDGSVSVPVCELVDADMSELERWMPRAFG